MSQAPLTTIQRFAIFGILFVATLILGASVAHAADGCPTSASEIDTDRPDVTNSSRVVPYGSLQVENGVDWTVRQRSDVISGTETRLRLGVAQCTELIADVPTYFYSLNGRASSGFSDFVLSIKRTTGSIRLPLICDRWFGIPDRRRQSFEPRIRSLHSIPLVATIR